MLFIKSILAKPHILTIIFCSILLLVLVKDIQLTYNYGLADLRNRVVGARALAHNLNPYTFKWQPGNEEELLNRYDSYSSPYSLCTATPAFLFLFKYLGYLSYNSLKYIWTVFAFLSVSYIFLSLYLKNGIRTNQRLSIIALAILILLSSNWDQSIIQGQYYFLFPFLLVFSYNIALGKDNNVLLFIVLAALSSLFRPILILILLPLLFNKTFHIPIIKSIFITGGLVGIYLISTAQAGLWKTYSSSSSFWISYYEKDSKLLDNAPSICEYVVNKKGGAVKLEAGSENRINSNFDSQRISSQVLNVAALIKTVTNKSVPLSYCIASWFIITTAFIGYLKLKRENDIDGYLFVGFIVYYLAEILLPVPKHSYYFPEILFPIYLLIRQGQLKIAHIIVLCGCLLIMCLPFKIFPLQLVCCEFFIIATLLIAFLSRNRKLIKYNYFM